MLSNTSSVIRRALFAAFFAIILLLPLTVFAQSLIVVRPRRRHVVVYRPQPYVIYQRPDYTSSYYSNPYYNNGYMQPYYRTSYYSNSYPQAYYVNPYAYSVYPTSSYVYNPYRPRYRRSHVRVGIWLR
jgi:hypothetical protein